MKRFIFHDRGEEITLPGYVFNRYRRWGWVMTGMTLICMAGWLQSRSMLVVHDQWQQDIRSLIETNESLLIRNQTSHELLVLASYQLWGVLDNTESWESFKQTMIEFDQLGPENLKDISKLQTHLKQMQRRY